MENANIKDLITAAAVFGEVQPIDIDAEQQFQVLSVPTGRSIVSIKKYLDEYLLKPERRKGTAVVTELGSFIEHVNRFKSEHSALFCKDDDKAPALTGVLNYHQKGFDHDPDWNDHRTLYRFPVSDEWATWSKEKEGMDQGAFASFLEDHIADVIDPTTATENTKAFADKLAINLAGQQRLMELSRGLSISVDQKVGSTVNLASGEGKVIFQETHLQSDGKQVSVPGGFAVQIPVFKDGALYQLPVRLRYRARNGSITWGFVPYRTDLVFTHAIHEAANKAKEGTALPLFFGEPE